MANNSPNSRWILVKNSIGGTVLPIKTGASKIWGWTIHNQNASETWVQLFNAASADVTLGTTAPRFTIKVKANDSSIFMFDGPEALYFDTGLSWAATTTETGSTGPAATLSAYLFYA